MKNKKRRKYNPDFKRNAVLLCSEPDRTVSEIAINLGISKDLLYRWRREYSHSNGKPVFTGNGVEAMTDEQARIRELEKKLHDTKMERDILKKAVTIFSKAPK